MTKTLFLSYECDGQWTHRSTLGRHRVIDYLLFSKRPWEKVSDVEASFDIGLRSDHRAVHGTLDLCLQSQHPHRRCKMRGWRPADKIEYDDRLASRLVEASCTDPLDIDGNVAAIEAAIGHRCAQIEQAIHKLQPIAGRRKRCSQHHQLQS